MELKNACKTVFFNMRQTFVLLVIFVALLACADSTGNRCVPICRKNVPSIIRCVRHDGVCHKLPHCTMQEINCVRSLLNRPRLIPTSLQLCRNIKSPSGSGQCAVIRKPRSTRRSCNRIHCTVPSKNLKCYRSKRNNCRLLTSCQLTRANCRRGSNNSLRATHPKACAGLKKAGRIQKCRPIVKSG